MQRQPQAPSSKQQLPNVQAAPINNKSKVDDVLEPSINVGPIKHSPNVIVKDDDSSVGNIFCFGLFADKRTGILYNDFTGLFPYMSLEGNVCFLIVYHYKSNAILVLLISGFNDNTIFAAYKTQFEFLESNGHKIRLNVMDNQCAKQIKKILTANGCNLLLVEPHNHHVNAAKRAIQTFKDHFISALAMTDSKFPLQLWDKLASQVENTLNLMQASRIDPNMSVYEAIWGRYNWNHFLLAPPGCKAVIYEFPNARGLWGSRGTDAWYFGPLVDHYRCNHYFVPETRAYQISGSAKLFPQHCQVPFLSTKDHLQELTNKMASTLGAVMAKKQQRVLTLVQAKLSDETICPGGPTFLTSPCHAWILPETTSNECPKQ